MKSPQREKHAQTRNCAAGNATLLQIGNQQGIGSEFGFEQCSPFPQDVSGNLAGQITGALGTR